MGLATDLVKFFYINFGIVDSSQPIKTIEDFCKSHPGGESLDIVEVLRLCTHLEQHGYLTEAGYLRDSMPHSLPFIGRSFVATKFSESKAEYGEYDFIGYGFARVRAELGDAVRPVVVTKSNGEEDIGTGFLIGNQNTLITARHVIQAMSRIRIPDRYGLPVHAKLIIVPEDSNLDVAVVLTEKPLSGLPFFCIGQHSLLDEVLCLGFPPIPGFQPILISDIATVNAEIKSSYGRVVGIGSAYIDGQRYFLINSRVKGGNSGGPIVDRKGYVVGILVQSSMNATDTSNLDGLGYGIATPVDEWIHLFANDRGAHGGIELPFQNLVDDGFSTL
jgi:serine protease Do